MPTAEGETSPTVSCCRWLPLQAQSAKVRVQDAKVRTSISASRSRMQQQHATPTITTTTDQLRISTGACGEHDAAIIATRVRAHIKDRAWKELELCALRQLQWLLHCALNQHCIYRQINCGCKNIFCKNGLPHCPKSYRLTWAEVWITFPAAGAYGTWKMHPSLHVLLSLRVCPRYNYNRKQYTSNSSIMQKHTV